MTRLCAGFLKNCGMIPGREEIFASSKCPDWLWGSSMVPVQWVSWALSPRVQWPWCEAHHCHLVLRLMNGALSPCLPDRTEFTARLNTTNLFNKKNFFARFGVAHYMFHHCQIIFKLSMGYCLLLLLRS
jgi:hypothetical protein